MESTKMRQVVFNITFIILLFPFKFDFFVNF